LPLVAIVYKLPRGNSPDWYALSVMGSILAGGQSSRLYQKIVKEKELAVNVGGGAQERRGPSLGQFVALARPGKDVGELEKIVYEEIDRIQNTPVADWELEKVRAQNRRQRAQQLQSTLSRAVTLGQFAVYYGDPRLINTFEDKINAITKEDVQRVARTYLKPTNRTVVVTIPKPRGGAPGMPGR